MKKLTREQMKNVFGGDDQAELTPADGGGCNLGCTTGTAGGTCSSSYLPGSGNLPGTTLCTCSVSGGRGC